jgi:glutamyl-tRNA reductase
LDSLVLGESQILGQVTNALELARGQKAAGPLLSRLFQDAISAGKRTRTETHISRNPASVSSLAANLAEGAVADLDRAQVVVIGAGEMAELAVEALRKRGAARILVANRSRSRAGKLAGRWGAQATTFEGLEAALTSADIVISSSGAPHPIIRLPLAARVMQLRPDRPLVAIDIAVPRDIEAEVGNLPGVHLVDIDNLNQRLEQSLSLRMQEVPRVEAILAEEEARFMMFLNTLEVLPLIGDLHRQAEAIRQSELEKSLRRLPNLSEVEKSHIEALTRALVKHLLDGPVNRLRAEAQGAHGTEFTSVARSLFDLPAETTPRPWD